MAKLFNIDQDEVKNAIEEVLYKYPNLGNQIADTTLSPEVRQAYTQLYFDELNQILGNKGIEVKYIYEDNGWLGKAVDGYAFINLFYIKYPEGNMQVGNHENYHTNQVNKDSILWIGDNEDRELQAKLQGITDTSKLNSVLIDLGYQGLPKDAFTNTNAPELFRDNNHLYESLDKSLGDYFGFELSASFTYPIYGEEGKIDNIEIMTSTFGFELFGPKLYFQKSITQGSGYGLTIGPAIGVTSSIAKDGISTEDIEVGGSLGRAGVDTSGRNDYNIYFGPGYGGHFYTDGVKHSETHAIDFFEMMNNAGKAISDTLFPRPGTSRYRPQQQENMAPYDWDNVFHFRF